MDPLLGMIMLWSCPKTPIGWFPCDGRQLPIQQYAALYSILGNVFGGDGKTYFNLPDLRSRIPVGVGQGTSLSPYLLGQKGGVESVALTVQQMAAHTHAASGVPNLSGAVSLSANGALPASKNYGSSDTPGANIFPAKAPDYVGQGLTADNIYGATDGTNLPVTVTFTPSQPPVTISGSVSVTVQNAGSNQAHPNIQPFLGMQYLIAYQGIYPDFNS